MIFSKGTQAAIFIMILLTLIQSLNCAVITRDNRSAYEKREEVPSDSESPPPDRSKALSDAISFLMGFTKNIEPLKMVNLSKMKDQPNGNGQTSDSNNEGGDEPDENEPSG